jgi:hypothetical protein
VEQDEMKKVRVNKRKKGGGQQEEWNGKKKVLGKKLTHKRLHCRERHGIAK